MNLILAFLVYRPDIGYVNVSLTSFATLEDAGERVTGCLNGHLAWTFQYSASEYTSFNSLTWYSCLEHEFLSRHFAGLLRGATSVHLLYKLCAREALHYSLPRLHPRCQTPDRPLRQLLLRDPTRAVAALLGTGDRHCILPHRLVRHGLRQKHGFPCGRSHLGQYDSRW